jgi:hypothetical protein
MHPPTFLLAGCVHGIVGHALKLISEASTIERCSPSRPYEHDIISTSMACLPRNKLPADQEIHLLQLS